MDVATPMFSEEDGFGILCTLCVHNVGFCVCMCIYCNRECRCAHVDDQLTCTQGPILLRFIVELYIYVNEAPS